jgi:N-acetylglutamate synthase-like GNAT family acetyltransferase
VQVLDGEPERADCVVVGFDSSADYARLRRAALLAQRGALLVATNADGSYPTPDGMWPGAGALLAAVTTTVGRPADEVVGKPHPTLYRTALQAAGGGTPLVVGDRLDTDIAGAGPLGWDSLLVFTGVARPPDLLATAVLPTYVAEDLSGLERDAPVIRRARREDTSGIEALLAHSGLNAQGVDERIEDTLVAEGEREPAGTASLELFGEIVHLRSVAVDERYRGRHVGALLVANAARLARERKGRELYAVTEDAAGFFQGLGFVPIGTRDSLPRPVAATPMVRDQCSIGSVALRLSLA